MRGLLLALFCLMTACATAPRETDANAAWHRGNHPRALALARAMVDRFREDNALSEAAIRKALTDTTEWLDTTPIPLSGDTEAPIGGTVDLARELRRDLFATGATRTLRAVRAISRLQLQAFAHDLIALTWRLEPWQGDTPKLATFGTALRSLVVKTAALEALEALAHPLPNGPP